MPDLIVNIDVDDLDKAIEFYTRALGLQVGRRLGANAVELLGTTTPIYLLRQGAGTPPFTGASRMRDYARHWTPVHLDFTVTDIETAARRAEVAGAKGETGITDHAWGRMAVFSDPFGHGFCLLQFTGRGYDEIAGG